MLGHRVWLGQYCGCSGSDWYNTYRFYSQNMQENIPYTDQIDPAPTSSPEPWQSLRLCWYVDYNYFLYLGYFPSRLHGKVGSRVLYYCLLTAFPGSMYSCFCIIEVIIFLQCIGASLMWCCVRLYKYWHHSEPTHSLTPVRQGVPRKKEKITSDRTLQDLA